MLGDDFHASLLNAEARAIYDSLLSAYRSWPGEDEYCYRASPFAVFRLMKDGLAAVSALNMDHPELLLEQPTLRQCGSTLTIRSPYSAEQSRLCGLRLEEELALLTRGLSGCGEWERERRIYARVASRYRYRQRHDPQDRPDRRDDHCVVGLLNDREGVCSAYASMLVLALRRAGIPCHRVFGGDHAWIMVYIHDIPLHCDVTWESHEGESSLSYSYFNLTSDEILRDHAPPGHALPQSRFQGYGYHRKNGCYFSSPRDAVKFIRASLWSGCRVVRLKTKRREAIDNIVRRGLALAPSADYRYATNEKQGTAIIQRTTGGINYA